ncbi:xaa-Pro aminopeptidase 3 [Bemisia tabaci]|uniref:xaa-Pro aminopeptidase 3 n=1 Tax=Bemisia tabaci TaxID=7038 RepID=UPI003B28672A
MFSASAFRSSYLCSMCRKVALNGSCASTQKSLSTQIEKLNNRPNPKFVYGQPTYESHPHLIKPEELVAGIKLEEFQERRRKLISLVSYQDPNNKTKNLLPGRKNTKHIIVIPGATKQYMSDKIPYVFRQNSDFFYLTGCLEQDSVLVISGEGEEDFISTIFMRPNDKQAELWDGPRTGPENAKQLFGVDKSFPVSELVPYLSSQILESPSHALWFDNLPQTQPVVSTSISALMNNLKIKVPESPRPYIHQLRLIKSLSEQRLMRRSCEIGCKSIEKTMAWTKAGMSEHELFAKVDFESRIGGADHLAYPPVVASGDNGTIIHYIENKQKMRDGNLVLMDAGCEFRGYSSDITRTWPVNGKFSPVQRIIYEVVYETQMELLKLCENRPCLDNLFHSMCLILGNKLKEAGVFSVNTTVPESLSKMAHELCPHHVSHYLGMDVHDVGTVPRTIPLQPGMVLTIEPGLYINRQNQLARPEFRGIGVRIEDDVLVTETGIEILTESCPKHPDDVEKIVQSIDSIQSIVPEPEGILH